MKRSTRMLLMNNGRNRQNTERHEHREHQPERRDYDSAARGVEAWGPYHSTDYPTGRTGFSLSGEIGRAPEIMDRKHQGLSLQNSMTSRTSGGSGEEYIPLSRSMAVEWTRDMKNSDGTHGPHWNMEQVQQVMEQREIDCDPVKFFAVLNAVYSDYSAVAKKHGVNKMDFYADLAKAWLEDDDAVEDKAGKYFRYIVKH